MPDASAALSIPVNWTFEDTAIARGFDRHVREQLPWYELATGAVAHVGRHYIPIDGLVYDLGAATGNIGRALEPTLISRNARLIPVEPSPEMAAAYAGPQREHLAIERAEAVVFEPFDLAIAFLTLMFVAPGLRRALLDRLLAAQRPGGAVIIFDKCEAEAGYPGTIFWRLALAGKLASGVDPAEIVAKELSLSGVQRPIARGLLPPHALEFFRFGEFAGYLIERIE
jgi:tRNA (cmo5U34)-methyltransferase